jgi:hypothetical protein
MVVSTLGAELSAQQKKGPNADTVTLSTRAHQIQIKHQVTPVQVKLHQFLGF